MESNTLIFKSLSLITHHRDTWLTKLNSCLVKIQNPSFIWQAGFKNFKLSGKVINSQNLFHWPAQQHNLSAVPVLWVFWSEVKFYNKAFHCLFLHWSVPFWWLSALNELLSIFDNFLSFYFWLIFPLILLLQGQLFINGTGI